MVNQKPRLCLLLAFSVFASVCQAEASTDNKLRHPFYVGMSGGYGSTTWDGLVPTEENKNMATSMVTPIGATEGGGVWGVFGGYELFPYFAIEAGYTRYPHATIAFDPYSIFSFLHDGVTELTTHTEALSVLGKVMFVIPNTALRLYSSAGVARVHRHDIVTDAWRFNPSFGVGLNYHFTERVMGEIAGNYTAGFGESQLNPAETYFPFLYSISFRLAYSF